MIKIIQNKPKNKNIHIIITTNRKKTKNKTKKNTKNEQITTLKNQAKETNKK